MRGGNSRNAAVRVLAVARHFHYVTGMTKRIFIPLLCSFILPHGLRAAGSTPTEKEYEQVRAIAFRDARVQSAYRDADRRLDAKIIKIDPALEPLVRRKQAAREGLPAPKTATVAPKPAPKPTPKPVRQAASVKPSAAKGTHTIASGETLGGIAAKHHVTVGALKSANHISDERKLRVGQVLVIPSGKGTPPPKKSDSALSRLMH